MRVIYESVIWPGEISLNLYWCNIYKGFKRLPVMVPETASVQGEYHFNRLLAAPTSSW